MKYICFVILFILRSLNVFGQDFSLKQLSDLVFTEHDDFETEVLKKGYEFYKVENNTSEYGEPKTYFYQKGLDNKLEMIAYTVHTFPAIDSIPEFKMASLTLSMTSSEIFSVVKEDIIRSGYKLTKTEERGGGHRVFKVYNNPELNIEVITVLDSENLLNTYELHLTFSPKSSRQPNPE